MFEPPSLPVLWGIRPAWLRPDLNCRKRRSTPRALTQWRPSAQVGPRASPHEHQALPSMLFITLPYGSVESTAAPAAVHALLRALPVAPHSLGLARIAAVDSAHKVCARRIDGPLLRMGSAEFAVEKTASAAFAADEACRYVAISHSMLQHGAAMWRRIRSR